MSSIVRVTPADDLGATRTGDVTTPEGAGQIRASAHLEAFVSDPVRDALMRARDAIAAALAAVDGPPAPAGERPAKPTGLTVTMLGDAHDIPGLSWDPAADATEWDVRDENNPDDPVQATVREPRSVRSRLRAGQRRRYTVVARNAVGQSDPSDAVDVPSGPGAEPPPPVPDGGSSVDLGGWKLTIPETSGGKVVEIRPPALATYSSRYFERLPDGSLRFRVWHGGATTSGSSNPRSELRERYNDDPEGYWPAGRGRHGMEWSGQVNRLTKVKPHLVIGQVHDDKDDVVVWRVEGDRLWLTNGDDPHGFLVDAAFTLGKPYTCRYEIVDGDYSFFYNGARLDYPLRSTARSYFKLGAYLQSNPKSAPGESTDEYAEVVLHSVIVAHS